MSGSERWHAVDARGLDLATGRPPRPPGSPSAVSALSAAPVPAWPVAVVDGDAQVRSVADVLGPGGDRVAALLDELVTVGPSLDRPDVEALARATPAGTVDLPVAALSSRDAVDAAAHVDAGWLATVDARRATPRHALAAVGRGDVAEAALHLAMLLATERLDPADDADVDAHVASGAQLWLLAGAVVSALAGPAPGPFAAWARLIVAGWWPVGPSGGRLVMRGPA